MMQYRSPTRHDIGKTVEVRNHENEAWKSIKLVSIDYDENSEPMYWERDGEIPGDRLHFYYQCRVPYTTADPITELSIAADLLAENGMDEAARVLALVANFKRRKLAGGSVVAELEFLMELKAPNPPEPQL